MLSRVPGSVLEEPQRIPINMWETTDALVVTAPMPCVRTEDITIYLQGSRLTIKAARRAPMDRSFLVHEWQYGDYERVVDVPSGFGAPLRAAFGNGQLALRLERRGTNPKMPMRLVPHQAGTLDTVDSSPEVEKRTAKHP